MIQPFQNLQYNVVLQGMYTHRVVFPSCQRALHRLTFIWCTVLYSECILQEFKPEPQLSFIYVELKDLTVIHLLYNHWDINSFSVTVSIEAANQKITSSSATLFSYNCWRHLRYASDSISKYFLSVMLWVPNAQKDFPSSDNLFLFFYAEAMLVGIGYSNEFKF